MSAKRFLGLAMVSSWLVAGCSSAKKIEVGGTCVLNSDCNSPLLCSDGKCHDACHSSIDCPAGENCVKTASSAVCQLPAEASCARTPCTGAYVCASDLQCRTPCESAADCADAQVCVTNVCADPIDIVPSTGQLPQLGPSLAADGGADARATAMGGTGGGGGSGGTGGSSGGAVDAAAAGHGGANDAAGAVGGAGGSSGGAADAAAAGGGAGGFVGTGGATNRDAGFDASSAFPDAPAMTSQDGGSSVAVDGTGTMATDSGAYVATDGGWIVAAEAGGVLISGVTVVGAQIAASGAMDHWTFQGVTGDEVVINAVTTSGTLVPTIYLYAPAGGASVANAGNGDVHALSSSTSSRQRVRTRSSSRTTA